MPCTGCAAARGCLAWVARPIPAARAAVAPPRAGSACVGRLGDRLRQCELGRRGRSVQVRAVRVGDVGLRLARNDPLPAPEADGIVVGGARLVAELAEDLRGDLLQTHPGELVLARRRLALVVALIGDAVRPLRAARAELA